MDGLFLELGLRWLHILAAVAMAGGSFFWWFVLGPAMAESEGAERQAWIQRIRPRWARVVMMATLILLVTGLWNAVRIIVAYDFEGGIYHALVTVKLVLALVIMGLAASLSGKSQRAERMREKLSFWLTVNAILAILIVCLAGFMKSVPRTLKPASAGDTVASVNAPVMDSLQVD